MAQWNQFAYLFALILVCSYAGRLGGWPERAGAAIMVVGSILTVVAAMSFFPGWRTPEAGIFIVDLLVLAAFGNLALYSDRFWPIWVTSFHLIAVTIHVATLVDPSVAARAYSWAAEVWAYPMLLGIAAGTRNHIRRQAPIPKANVARY